MKRTLFVLGVIFLTAPAAYGCECEPPSQSKAYRRAAAVFIGKVIEVRDSNVPIVEGADYSVAVKFRVSRYWKGGGKPELTIHTEQGVLSCNEFKFEEGAEYLVYANGKQLIAFAGCSRSAPLSDADYIRDELKRLGPGKIPKGTGADSESRQPHNNGMHPTADTRDFMYLHRCGAAGDAGRSAAYGGTRR
jgi:hypothetical protein